MSSKNGERVFPLRGVMPTPATITAAWITKTTAVPKRLFTAFLCFWRVLLLVYDRKPAIEMSQNCF